MKLISLNTWGGVVGLKVLLNFFETNKDVDVFCLQEVWSGGEHIRGKVLAGIAYNDFVSELYQEIGKVLKKHDGYFRVHYHDFYGLATFIKKDIKILKEGEVFVFKSREHIFQEDPRNHARNIQYVTFVTDYGPRTAINFHGL